VRSEFDGSGGSTGGSSGLRRDLPVVRFVRLRQRGRGRAEQENGEQDGFRNAHDALPAMNDATNGTSDCVIW
jgi:hypothetical protein